MTAEEQRTVIDRYIGAYNNLDIAGMMALMHPNVVFKNVSGGEVNAAATGAVELRVMANQSKPLFSSRHQAVSGFESAGEGAIVDVSFEGTVALDLPNGIKTGEVLRLKGRTKFEFWDGKLYRITDYS